MLEEKIKSKVQEKLVISIRTAKQLTDKEIDEFDKMYSLFDVDFDMRY